MLAVDLVWDLGGPPEDFASTNPSHLPSIKTHFFSLDK